MLFCARNSGKIHAHVHIYTLKPTLECEQPLQYAPWIPSSLAIVWKWIICYAACYSLCEQCTHVWNMEEQKYWNNYNLNVETWARDSVSKHICLRAIWQGLFLVQQTTNLANQIEWEPNLHGVLMCTAEHYIIYD